MDLFDAKSRALIEQLQLHHVKHLLAGGYAVNIHGYSRGTGDMDIWIEATEANVRELAAAFLDCGYDIMGLIEYAPQVPANGLSLRISDEEFILDIMTHIDGIEFASAYYSS